MPEGDTIFRAAQTLQRALAGKPVVFFESMLPALGRVEITGRTIDRVSTAGKHLLMHFSGALVLRTHMRMNGSWHIYRRGERWQRPRRDMRVVIATDDFEAVGFSIPEAELIATRDLRRHDDLRKLGPDLLAEAFDAGEALRRLRERGDTAVADALLNQRVMAGIGNVYKSEVLFLCGVNPFLAIADVEDERLRCLLATARTHLQANVADPTAAIVTYRGFRRTTRRADPSERLYVYGRAGQACRKCGSRIEIRAQGRDARLTYWCPSCQAASTSSSGPMPRRGQSPGGASD